MSAGTKLLEPVALKDVPMSARMASPRARQQAKEVSTVLPRPCPLQVVRWYPCPQRSTNSRPTERKTQRGLPETAARREAGATS